MQVVNVAVLVDEKHPVRCASQIIPSPVLEMQCRTLVGNGTYATETYTATCREDFQNLSCHKKSDNTSNGPEKEDSCVLLRAAMLVMNIVRGQRQGKARENR